MALSKIPCVSRTSSLSVPASPRVPKDLSKADLERLKSRLRPHEVAAWIDDVSLTLVAYHPPAAKFVLRSAEEARRARAEGETEADRTTDLWAARNALNALDHASDYVVALVDDMRHERKEARFSVALFFAAVRQSARMNPEAGRLASEAFKVKTFFAQGASLEQSMASAASLREEFLALPSEYTGAKNAIFRALLDHLPPALDSQRQFWQDRLFDAECTGAPLPWTFPQLSRLVAQAVLVSKDRQSPLSVSAAFGRGRQAPDRDRGAGVRGGELHCWNCGSDRHLSRQCTKQCSTCGLRVCPGVRGEPCPVKGDGDLRLVKNAKGGVLPDHIVQRLKDRRAAINKGFKVSLAAVADDDLDDDLYPPLDEEETALDFLEEQDDPPSSAQVSALQAQAAERQRSHLSALSESLQQLSSQK